LLPESAEDKNQITKKALKSKALFVIEKAYKVYQI